MESRAIGSTTARSRSTGTPTRPLQFVGLGDSLTQGVGDPRAGRAGFAGQLDGWVSYFAGAVRASGQAIDVRNYAVAGARIEHVTAGQLQPALADQADVMSCFIGINDLWDANLDLDIFAKRFNALFAELAAHSPIVITASVHDVFAPFPVRAPLRQKLLGNIAAMNEIVGAAVSDFDLVLIDLAGRPEMFTSAVRAVDRLHPNRYGHQLIAVEVVNALQDRGYLVNVVPPDATPVRRGVADLAHVAWVSGYVKENWSRWREEIAASKATTGSS